MPPENHDLRTCVICGNRYPRIAMQCSNGVETWICKDVNCLNAYVNQKKGKHETHQADTGSEPQVLVPKTPANNPPKEAEGAD